MSSTTQSLRVGLSRGFPTEKRPDTASRPARRKGALSKRVAAVRDVIREVAGFAPYEKRILDIFKTGGGNAEKRAYKLAKARLGSHRRALRKREEIKTIYGKQRAKQ